MKTIQLLQTIFCCFFPLCFIHALRAQQPALPPKPFDGSYEYCLPLDNGGWLAAREGQWRLLDAAGAPLLNWGPYEYIGAVRDGRVLVRQGQKYGYADPAGNLRIALQYDRAEPFGEGLANVCQGRKCSWIDTAGRMAIAGMPAEEDDPEPGTGRFNADGLLVVSKWVRRPALDKGDLKKGRLPSFRLQKTVTIGNREETYTSDKMQLFGVMDRNGRLVLPIEYESVSLAESGVISVQKNGRFGLAGRSGRILIPPVYMSVVVLRQGYVLLSDGMYTGLADTTGDIIVPLKQYHSISLLNNGLLRVGKNNKSGIVDLQGKEIVPLRYHHVGDWSEGLVRVGKLKAVSLGDGSGAVWGWVDASGKEVIELQYDEAGDFCEGVAPVFVRKKGWGLIAKDGRTVLEPSLSELGDFQGGLARAKKDGRWGWINTRGEWAIAAGFEAAKDFNGALAPARAGKQWGLVDRQGQWVLEPVFARIAPLPDSYFEGRLPDDTAFRLTPLGKVAF